MIFEISDFNYSKASNMLSASISLLELARYPDKFSIHSAQTDTTVNFFLDEETMINNEHFDGEMCVYKSNEHSVKVTITAY